MRDTLLLFRNKRAVIFMRRYLKRAVKGALFMPRMQTLSSYLAEFSSYPEAPQVVQLLTLYDAYHEVSTRLKQNPVSFDRFRFWGEMMLSDFEDVDLQLADAEDVFTNVKRLEEIQTDFLDEDQRDVAREIWGYDPKEFEGFKNNRVSKGRDDVVYEGFLTLSEMLFPIYERFHQILEEKKLTTRGMTARHAAETIERMDVDDPRLPVKVGFVGFSILTRAERSVLTTFKKLGNAEFFWDKPDMLRRDLREGMKDYFSPLDKYIDKLTAYFPMPEGYQSATRTTSPDIRIIGVPSETMQAKVAGNIIEELKREKRLHPDRADGTAVVLPDAKLLTSVLHSVRVSPVNVTMGLPIRYTPFATLLSLVIKLNMSSRKDASGDTLYLTKNVANIVSHPSLSTLAPEGTRKLRNFLRDEGRFMTPYSKIEKKSPELSFVFRPVAMNENLTSAKDFIIQLIDGMSEMLRQKSESEASEKRKADLHEYRVLTAMKKAVDTLVDAIETYSKYVKPDDLYYLSFYRLIERQLNKEQLNFTGSPLTGVQIMGTLETRSLDFDNVVMLSMNEKTFPPRQFIRSLIPAAIRAGFGLSTIEEHEIDYAWIYANLVSRCDRAYLLFDASAQSKGRGGMSRYLFQTRYIYNLPNPRYIGILPKGGIDEAKEIKIKKDETVMAELKEFLKGGSRSLSVSALEKYGECPLKFYLSKVKGIGEPKKDDTSIDDSVIGSVVHQVLQTLFNKVIANNEGRMDENVSFSDDIRSSLASSLNEKWYFGNYSNYYDMPYEAQMQIDFWSERIKNILDSELQRRPYTVECCEMSPEELTGKRVFDWKLEDDLSLRFTFYVDRVDRLDDGTLRFIDYKTGADSLKVTDMDSLFWIDVEDKKRVANKAIFQLLTYAHAYHDLMEQNGTPFTGDIVLEITKVVDPKASIGKEFSINDGTTDKSGRFVYKKFTSYKDSVVSTFRERLVEMVRSIFNPETSFTQTDDLIICQYCQFSGLCQRNPEKKW